LDDIGYRAISGTGKFVDGVRRVAKVKSENDTKFIDDEPAFVGIFQTEYNWFA